MESKNTLPENHYFMDGILLPVEIIPINNTENCCSRCKGVGETCEQGGSFVYCDILNHFAMQDSGLDVSGDSLVGCNNFRPKTESKEQAAREYADKYHFGLYSEEKDKAHVRGFIAGAEWQAHNLPSVEQVIEKAKELGIDHRFSEKELLQLLNYSQGRG